MYFHSKYKFEPAIRTFEERNAALETIAEDKSLHFRDLSDRAKYFQRKVNENQKNSKKLRQLTLKTNDIVKEYIKRVLEETNPQKNHPFKRGMDMILDMETIQQNKDFFNALFEKHGIEYKI